MKISELTESWILDVAFYNEQLFDILPLGSKKPNRGHFEWEDRLTQTIKAVGLALNHHNYF